MPDNKALDPYTVAKIYWTKLPIEHREWKRVAKELKLQLSNDKSDVARLNRLGRMCRRWEERGLVRHIVLREDSEAAARAERIQDLEEALRKLYPLRHVVVCNTTESPDEDDGVRDDSIHKQLGEWGGRILNVSLRGEGEVVGTGGGRGPHYSALACRYKQDVDYPQKVVSLTGRIRATDWSHRDVQLLNADLVAGQLASQLNAKELVRLRSDIVPREPDTRVSTKEVTFALTGVGALAGGHRFLNFENRDELAPIRKELEKLKELLGRIEDRRCPDRGPAYHWVGDLCNHLFVCPPPIELSKAQQSLRGELEQLVLGLNAKLLSPTLEQMRDICRRGAVMAVCGGRHKIVPIWHLLRQPKPVISHLILDKFCAESILDLETQSPPANHPPSKRPREARRRQES